MGGRWLALALMAAALLGCGRAAPPDPEMAVIQAKFGALKLSWVTRRVVGGQAIVCGYAGPPRKAQVFIARAGKVFVPTDLPSGQFDHWEDQLCGPDWIKPLGL